MEPTYAVELLDVTKHRRQDFLCKSPELTDFLRKRARKEMRSKTSVCFVMAPREDPGRIAGFYTLSSTSLALSELPEEITRKLPRYPFVPATLIGRLARDQDFKGENIGPLLLRDAAARALIHAREIGSAILAVKAKDEKAIRFYARFGFRAFAEKEMFLPMSTVDEWVGEH